MTQDLAVTPPHATEASRFSSYEMRGQRVVLDADLARLFGVETKRLNQQLRRNLDRFSGYAFQLGGSDLEILRLQNVTSSGGHGGRRSLPWAFTEHGVVMVATILNSDAAITAMRLVVETFVATRRRGERLPASSGLAPRLCYTVRMWSDLRAHIPNAARRAYLAAFGAVLLAFALRFVAHPVFGDNHPYSLFFPVVLLCAYALGRGPAVFAAALSAALAYWTFVEPRFAVAIRLDATAPLVLFGLTAGVAIYLITGLTSALRSLAADQGRLHAMADANAGLFRDLQRRIAHHMTLLVGVLTLQARGEPDPEVLLLLRKAGERSELIARAHRELAGSASSHVDFAAFAESLARLTCADAKQPAVRIEVSGGPLIAPTEVATSLGVALVECLAWILRHEPVGTIRVDLRSDEERLRVWIGLAGELGEAPNVRAPAAFIFQAMVEQLGAALSVRVDGLDGAGLELTVPLPGEPPVLRSEVTVH